MKTEISGRKEDLTEEGLGKRKVLESSSDGNLFRDFEGVVRVLEEKQFWAMTSPKSGN